MVRPDSMTRSACDPRRSHILRPTHYRYTIITFITKNKPNTFIYIHEKINKYYIAHLFSLLYETHI